MKGQKVFSVSSLFRSPGRPDKNAVILGTPGKGGGFRVNLFDEINPEIFVQYLQNAGWKLFPRKRQDIKVFQIEKKDQLYQVTIPLDRTLGDYRNAMQMAVKEVALYEDITEWEVLLCLFFWDYNHPNGV
ncbi:hypothetical protein [Eubacterium sp. An3]|uniref:hypothetical protein n=1 Tax=Eubacterium sp. An3 TaxID=1965628 RepID=UPI000B3AD90E|nr:hypothetical protein [Eubacterium sp. An3]OUO24788.1 hypothetical protein B5F87_19125 [Eubacterium sp. An3]